MNDHRRFATSLPGNTSPDVPREPLPDTLDEAIAEFLRRLGHVRGKYGRAQIGHTKLVGWEHFGGDLDQLDALAGEAAAQAPKVYRCIKCRSERNRMMSDGWLECTECRARFHPKDVAS